MDEAKSAKGRRRRFSSEFKVDAVWLVVRECGVESTLEELRRENIRLRRELRRAEPEREILRSYGVFREGVAVKYASGGSEPCTSTKHARAGLHR